MKKTKILLVALSVVVLMLSATLVVAIAGENTKADDRSAARTEADLTAEYIVAVTVQGTPIQLAGQQPNWQQSVSTGAIVNYSLTTTVASSLPLDELNITWRLETDLNTTVFAYGADVSFIWSAEATHHLSVTYANATNAGDVGRQFITLQVSADFDEDGLPDLWERQYFGNLGTSDGTGDYDNDGWTDLEEEQNGTDPTKVNAKPGFIDQYWWVFMIIALILVFVLLLWFVIMPKSKAKRDEEEKKKIAAAVDVEKSLLGMDDLEYKPKK
jgi:cbb3-type cytochrome oxidase subunit 3